MSFWKVGKIHRCWNAFNLLGETSDVIVCFFDFRPFAPAINFAVIGSINPYTNLDFLHPWSRADIITCGLINQIELPLGKSDIRIGMPPPVRQCIQISHRDWAK